MFILDFRFKNQLSNSSLPILIDCFDYKIVFIFSLIFRFNSRFQIVYLNLFAHSLVFRPLPFWSAAFIYTDLVTAIHSIHWQHHKSKIALGEISKTGKIFILLLLQNITLQPLRPFWKQAMCYKKSTGKKLKVEQRREENWIKDLGNWIILRN